MTGDHLLSQILRHFSELHSYVTKVMADLMRAQMLAFTYHLVRRLPCALILVIMPLKTPMCYPVLTKGLCRHRTSKKKASPC